MSKWKNAVINKNLIPDVLLPDRKIEIIKQIIGNQYNLTWEAISKKGRNGDRVIPKQMFMYFARELTKEYAPRTSLATISGHLEGENGELTHSTILRAIIRLNNIQSYDKEFRANIELIRTILLEKFEQERNLIKFTE